MPIYTRSSSLTPCIFLRSAHTRAYTHTRTCKHNMHNLSHSHKHMCSICDLFACVLACLLLSVSPSVCRYTRMPIYTRSSSLTPCIFLRSAHTRAYIHTHTCKHDMHTLHACMNMHACMPKHVLSLHVCLSVALVYFLSLSLSLSLLTHTYMHVHAEFGRVSVGIISSTL